MINFEDDTNVFGSGDKIKQLESVKNEEMKKLKIWFDLSLNISKTKFMLFGKDTVNTKGPVEVDGVAIEGVHENKFLGLTMDKNMLFRGYKEK